MFERHKGPDEHLFDHFWERAHGSRRSATPTRPTPYRGEVTTVAADPRTAPVEDNLIAMLATVPGSGAFGTDGHDDVLTYHHATAFPLFNALAAPRFLDRPAEAVRERIDQVNAPFTQRGLPFLWWLTPSSTSDLLDEHLLASGFHVQHSPGMHARLDAIPDVRRPELTIRPVDAAGRTLATDTLLTGFGMPPEVGPAMIELTDALGDQWLDLVATVDGVPVAGGSLSQTGACAGLYNIYVLEEHRGRGYGAAVTAALMAHARERGCVETILHSTEAGYPVYQRLGFETVCRVSQYVWLPEG